jgi:hypothetical protein
MGRIWAKYWIFNYYEYKVELSRLIFMKNGRKWAENGQNLGKILDLKLF